MSNAIPPPLPASTRPPVKRSNMRVVGTIITVAVLGLFLYQFLQARAEADATRQNTAEIAKRTNEAVLRSNEIRARCEATRDSTKPDC